MPRLRDGREAGNADRHVELGPAAGLQRMQLASVDAKDAVDCPLGSGRRLRDCLQCPYLVALGDASELTIVCDPPLSA